jgi:hypothetical protein
MMSRIMFFVLLTVAAAGGAVIDRITVTTQATVCPHPDDAAMHKFLSTPDFPITGGKRY